MLCVIVYTYSSVMVAGTKVAKEGAITGTQPILHMQNQEYIMEEESV